MRILHIADVHLDRPFVGLPPEARGNRRLELREALARCLDAARGHEVDAVTIGGDLWEDENVTADTRASVAHLLGSVEVPVLLICGNHDPYLPSGNYARTNWPGNVHVFKESTPSEFRLDGVSVWGVSWTGGQLNADFLERTVLPDDGRTHLLLLHGTASHPIPFLDPAQSHCPFEPTRVVEAGFALCLAGHVHSATADDGLVYPGSPEPLAADETGRHCYALVETEGGRVSTSLTDINRRRFEQLEVDIAGAGSSAEVEERVAAALPGPDESLYLTLELLGEVGSECEVAPDQLEGRFAEGFGALRIRDLTRPAYDVDALARQQTARGRFVRRLQERMADANESERASLELALIAGLRALDGHREVA